MSIQKLLLIAALFTVTCVNAQKNVQRNNQIWTGYFNQTRINKHWGFWAEAQLRTNENFVDNISQSILRVGGTYYLNNDTKLTAGYAFVNNFSPANGAKVATPEHRPWQQIQWHTKYNNIRLMQWVRLEERYRQRLLNANELDKSFAFNFRARYNFLIQVPLSKKKFQPNTFSFIANDEVQINFGKEIVYNSFDQNRLFLGFSYQTNQSNNLQVGYMNLFQQLATGNQYKNLHVLRVFYFHNINLMKKSR